VTCRMAGVLNFSSPREVAGNFKLLKKMKIFSNFRSRKIQI